METKINEIKLKKLGLTIGQTPGAIYELSASDNKLLLLRDKEVVSEIETAKLLISDTERIIIRYRVSDTLPSISNNSENEDNYYDGSNWNRNIIDTDNSSIWMASARMVNNEIVGDWTIVRLRKNITVEKLSLLTPFIIRDRGKWQVGNTYVNLTLSETESEVRYVDIVWTDTVYDEQNGTITEGSYYMPKVKSITITDPTKSPDKDSYNWERALSMNFSFINTLIANIVSAKSVQANELLITRKNEDNSVDIVAGMTSTTRSSNEPDVRIWSGAITEAQFNNDGSLSLDVILNVENAPFRVYENGKAIVENIEVIGNGTFGSLKTNLCLIITDGILNLNNYKNYSMYMVYIQNPSLTINFSVNDTVMFDGKTISPGHLSEFGDICCMIFNINNNFVVILSLNSAEMYDPSSNPTPTTTTAEVNVKPKITNVTGSSRVTIELNESEILELNNNWTSVMNLYSIIPANTTYYCMGLKGWLSHNIAANTFYSWLTKTGIYSDKWDYCTTSLLYSTKSNSQTFFWTSLADKNLEELIMLPLFPRTGIGFDNIDNEHSIYWFGEIRDGKYVFCISNPDNETLTNTDQFIFEAYEEQFKKFLQNSGLLLRVKVQCSNTTEETIKLPNGTLINNRSRKVVGYVDDDNDTVTSYVNYNISIDNNGTLVIVPPEAEATDISTLDPVVDSQEINNP